MDQSTISIDTAVENLRVAATRVCQTFHERYGLDSWGDVMAVDDGHTRPARMTVWELELDECYYFLTKARYRTGPGDEHMAHAVRYFLPRFAKHFLDPFREWETGWVDPRHRKCHWRESLVEVEHRTDR